METELKVLEMKNNVELEDSLFEKPQPNPAP
jgi:hypothetical protein